MKMSKMKITCPRCGAEMESIDGAILAESWEEFACPECGLCVACEIVPS